MTIDIGSIIGIMVSQK